MTAPRTPAQQHAGNHGGMANVPLPAPTESAATIQARIDAHQATMPDWRIAKLPDAPKHIYAEYHDWAVFMDRLRTRLGMAQAHEAHGWRDASGVAIVPVTWSYGRSDTQHGDSIKAEPTAYVAEQRRLVMERSAAHKANPGGRPRGENPSADAIRCRERRAASVSRIVGNGRITANTDAA